MDSAINTFMRQVWTGLDSRAANAARERERYAGVFEQAVEALLITDRHGNIGDLNAAAAELLGCQKQRLIGKPLAALIAAWRVREFRLQFAALCACNTWRTTLRGGEEIDLAVRKLPDGSHCWRLLETG